MNLGLEGRVALVGGASRGLGRTVAEELVAEVLCVTSITAKRPVDNLLLSNALRPAVAGFAHSLAREVAKDGITVNTIVPGYTRTERTAELNVGAETVAEIPLGRLGEPREFAATAAFLVSERASYITGAAVPVDGGWLGGMF